jgi:internalin A
MKQFELIFQVKNEPDQFIAAQYLPKENPEKNSKSYLKLRNRCDQHAFTIRYPVFMPRSAITRLICRYGNLAEDVFWRNGIVFEKDGITVHLECGEDRKVKVDMDQLHPTVAYDIFNNMQEINQRHADLEVSGNGADFVRIANLQEHPATNPQIRATNHNWLPIEDFQIIMGGHGTHQEFEAVHHHVPRPRGAAKTNASRIYFSYAWADQREGGSDHQRRIVDQLYDSLREDGHQVLRDNMDLEYGGLISKYMQELGRGDLILVFLSDAYVRSPYCMYELCEISRNQKREQELFRTRILPVPLEHISFDKPKVLKPYIGYWKNELKEWEELIKDDTDYISGQQFKRYEYTREITRQFGELSDWLIDINASRIDLLTADNFAVIKTAIKKRLEQMNE